MRTKVYFEYVVNKHATDNYICFDKEQIELYDYDNNTYKKYNYSEIDRINISICSRAFSNTIRNNEIERVEFFSTGLVTRFFIDIDIKINNSCINYIITYNVSIKTLIVFLFIEYILNDLYW